MYSCILLYGLEVCQFPIASLDLVKNVIFVKQLNTNNIEISGHVRNIFHLNYLIFSFKPVQTIRKKI